MNFEIQVSLVYQRISYILDEQINHGKFLPEQFLNSVGFERFSLSGFFALRF